mmetsp:Transcript_118992/g.167236  ORF Transcript_118992/g.167236 Transcript_118992/m.167236 type:complete len:244 (-) Transcript_118992:32-763(-)
MIVGHPRLHDSSQESLTREPLITRAQGDVHGPQHLLIPGVIGQDGLRELEYGCHDELAECPWQRAHTFWLCLQYPHLLLCPEVVVAPEPAAHLLLLHAHLLGVHLGEVAHREAPTLRSTAERHSALEVRIDLKISGAGTGVGGEDHVHQVDAPATRLVDTFGISRLHRLVQLVHEDGGPEAGCASLPQDGLVFDSQALNEIVHHNDASSSIERVRELHSQTAGVGARVHEGGLVLAHNTHGHG